MQRQKRRRTNENKSVADSPQMVGVEPGEGLTLPAAHCYLLEEPPPLVQKDPYFRAKLDLIRLRAALLTVLTKHAWLDPADPDTFPVFSIRPSLIGQHS